MDGAEGSVISNGCVQCGQFTATRSRDAAACNGFPQYGQANVGIRKSRKGEVGSSAEIARH